MRAIIVAAAVLGLGLSACAKNDGQAADAAAQAEEQARERASEATAGAEARLVEASQDEGSPGLSVVSPSDAAAHIDTAVFVDLNRTAARVQHGVIPGAVLLTGVRDLGELPGDRSTTLIFYGADNENREAPLTAAAAQLAGYSDVYLLQGGVSAWTAAGYETDVYAQTARDVHAPHAGVYTVSALQRGLAEGRVQPVDVNGAANREEFGSVPTAILLSGVNFEASELPADQATTLVFYCTDPACTAAPRAATRASELGYTDVNVLVPGIRGWVAATAGDSSAE